MSAMPTPGVDLTDDRGPQVIRAVVACSVLSGLAFAGRMVSRKLMKTDFLVSDCPVALGLLGAWLLSGFGVWSKHHLALMLLWHKASLQGPAHPLQM